jgi:hypothetical protein
MVITQKMFANIQFLVDGLGWLNKDRRSPARRTTKRT